MIAILLAIGGLLTAHVAAGWEIRQQRVTGIAIGTTVLVLTATGYLSYYAGNEWLRENVSAVHWILGLGSPAIFYGIARDAGKPTFLQASERRTNIWISKRQINL